MSRDDPPNGAPPTTPKDTLLTTPDEPTTTTPTEPTPTTPTVPTPTTSTEQVPTTPNSDGCKDPVVGILSTAPVMRHSTPASPSPLSPKVFHSFERDHSHPEFITTSIIEDLNSVDGGPHWVEMVRSYLKLESQYRSRVRSFLSPLIRWFTKCI